MENTLSVILIALALVLGLVSGLVLAPGEVIKEVPVNVEVIKEIPIEVVVPSVSAYLDKSVLDFMEYVEDEELLTCDGNEYDFDEISISKVYDAYSVELDKEDYTVTFKIKLDYNDDIERTCKETFNVKVYYKDNDEVEITI